jgi:hypothetical protein
MGARRSKLLEVYGASYFYEGNPEEPVIVLWALRTSEAQVREIRIPYVYFGRGDTTWTRLFDEMRRPLLDREDWQYDRYRDRMAFFHMESLQPITIPEPGDSESEGPET